MSDPILPGLLKRMFNALGMVAHSYNSTTGGVAMERSGVTGQTELCLRKRKYSTSNCTNILQQISNKVLGLVLWEGSSDWPGLQSATPPSLHKVLSKAFKWRKNPCYNHPQSRCSWPVAKTSFKQGPCQEEAGQECFNFYFFYIYLFVWGEPGHRHANTCTWRSEGNLEKLVLSLYQVGSTNKLKIIRAGSKPPYLLILAAQWHHKEGILVDPSPVLTTQGK